MDKTIHYFRIWKRYTLNSFSTYLDSRFGAAIFLTGKLLRFLFFLIFLFLLLGNTKNLGGFNIYQVTFFFLTFNLIDTITQLLYREVYRFRPLVVEGRFDYVLLQPINSLFRSLAGGADFLDMVMLIPVLAMIIYVAFHLSPISLIKIILYIILLINSFVLTTALHIIVLAVGILTTTVDHTIMIYRDLTSMGRIPIDIYKEPLRSLLTFIIPVGVIMTFPAKALMGLLSIWGVVISLLIAGVFLYGSLRLWRFALTKYTSASS